VAARLSRTVTSAGAADPAPPCGPPTPPPLQGSGQNLYTAIVRWYQNDTLSPVIIRPAYYGLLLFQQAVRSDGRLLPAAVVGGTARRAPGPLGLLFGDADRGPSDGIKVGRRGWDGW
jgi:hypothetical protein